MKILAIDYGEKKIGLAHSDELGIVAAKLPVLFVKKAKDRIDGVVYVIKNINPQKLLIGMPTGLNGKESEQEKEVKDYIINLQKAIKKELKQDMEIITWDETYSSKQAEEGKSAKFRKTKSDSEAARIILQEYLDSIKNEK